MDIQKFINFKVVKSFFEKSYWVSVLAFSYLASLSLFYFISSGFSLDDFVRTGDLGSTTRFILFMALSMGVIFAMAWYVKSRIAKYSYLLALAALAIVFSFNFINNGPIEKYISILIISFSISTFLYLVFLPKISYEVKGRSSLLYILPIIFFVAFALVSSFRVYNFNSHAYDMGIFAQAFYKFSHLAFDNTVRKLPNLWGDHFHPILLPLSFLYKVFPSVYLLSFLQAALVALGFLPVYLIAKNILKSSTAGIFMATAYLSFIGIGKAIEFDFHPIVIATTAFLFLFYFFLKEKWLWYWFFLFILLLFQEDVSIFVFFLGIFIFLSSKKYKKIGLVSSIIGLVWFLLVVKLIIPHFANQEYIYFAYKSLGGSFPEVVRNVIVNPLHALWELTNHPLKLETVLSSFGSFGFLIFISPSFFLLAIPMMGEGLWNDEISRWSGFHYGAIVAPVLAISAIFSIKKILSCVKARYQKNLLSFLLVSVLVCSVVFSLERRNPIYKVIKPSFYHISSETLDLHRILSDVPKNASVSAQHSVVPLLSGRDEIYEYPGCILEQCQKSQFFVLSLAGSSWPLDKSGMKDEINKFLIGEGFRSQYGLYKRVGTSFIFKKGWQSLPNEVEAARFTIEQNQEK
jgi:uncharacterized membrane protein